MNGGERVARVLERCGVRHLFTLCGGHISPILVAAKQRGLRVVDVRHEATAVFAADAVGRLTGVPGVAAVTAGPGVTNAVTALQNARLAESPLVLLGGATATLLEGRGSLQDIDQLSLMRPLVKEAIAVDRVRDVEPAVERALWVAAAGVPGPVFVQLPVDLLYDRELVAGWYGGAGGKGLAGKATSLYLDWHARRLFRGAGDGADGDDAAGEGRLSAPPVPAPAAGPVRRATRLLARAERPVLVVGSGAVAVPREAPAVAAAVERLGLPTYLAGMARGLLGRDHRLHLRHARTRALREADLVVLAGQPVDFRLDYGRKIARRAKLVAAGRDRALLERNRRPTVQVEGDAGRFLQALAGRITGDAAAPGARARERWWRMLREREAAREEEIAVQAAAPAPPVNPLALCRAIEAALPERAVLVADGGDFVATASYTVRPRAPLSWLDPGVFGTLGVGAGFALAAALCRGEAAAAGAEDPAEAAQVWLLWGDGSAGYGLIELDTFVRHGLPVVAVVGNDASWMQIAREQVEILGDPVATDLARSDYHVAAEGLGARGLLLDDPARASEVLAEARRLAAAGEAVLVNAHLGRTDFRKGSISM